MYIVIAAEEIVSYFIYFCSLCQTWLFSNRTIMNKRIITFCICIFPVLFHVSIDSAAQRPIKSGKEIEITGWTDDSHYIIRQYGNDRLPVHKSVDIRSGKAVVIQPEKKESEIVSEMLPGNFPIGYKAVLSPDRESAVVITGNDLFLTRKGMGEPRRLTFDDDIETNVQFSPDGTKIAYTAAKDLYFLDLLTYREFRLTFDATDRIYNGYASWVYMEEILGRASEYSAFWWSPDSRKIAFLRTDETDVPLFTLNRLEEADGLHGLLEQVPYPKAGDPNPKVRMGMADISSGRITWVKTDCRIDQYIAWPFWKPDGSKLAVQVLNRDQDNLQIILADPETGNYKEIYRESRKTWVQFFEDVYVMRNGKGFILRSSKSDWENLYLCGWEGKEPYPVTRFDWRVNEVVKVDEEGGMIYFTGTGPESTDNHLFRINLDGSRLLQVTKGPGVHEVSISQKGSYFIDSWNNITTPGSIIALDKRGRIIKEIHSFEQPEYEPDKHSRSELARIKTSDGLFEMPAMITFPVNFDPSRKYPVVFTIYGGPDSKNITGNSWQDPTPSWYSSNGIITFKVDHRGSGHFGKKGLDYLHRALGSWEILDYTDAVRWLLEKPYVDGSRMGIAGSSYGGYMTCLALTKGSAFWTHGIAGSPVTDFRLYDNIYTERYMDTPGENPDGYDRGSALKWAGNLKGKLHLTHGDLDDNVHLQNTIQLISRLQDEIKYFSFMLYPGQRHGWGGPKAMSLRNENNSFWIRHFFDK